MMAMKLLVIASLLLSSIPASATVRIPAAALRTGTVRLSAPATSPAARLTPAFSGSPMGALPTTSLTPLSLTAAADAPVPSATPLTPAAAAEQVAGQLRGTEIILIQAIKNEKGRSRGYDLSKQIEEIVKRRQGTVRGLERDGPAEIFADTFALEVQGAVKDEVLAELAALENADVRSLSDLLALGSRRVAPELPDNETLKGYAERIKTGTLTSRWTAFAELATMLEAVGPERLAALPVETRDALVFPLYGIAADAVNAFNLVQGAARADLRKTLHAAKGEDAGWAGIEEGAQQGLKNPAILARFAPLRAHLQRALETVDRLDTPQSRRVLMQVLPHADFAGLEIAARPDRAPSYVGTWLADLEGSIEEMRQGLLAPERDEKDKDGDNWHGSSRSGGYTHVEGGRHSSSLYLWRPYRTDLSESRNELLLMLGLPSSGVSIVEPLLDLLTSFQDRWPELQALHKQKQMARDYAGVERNVAYYVKQAQEAGRPYTEEQVAQIRASLRKDIEEQFERHRRLDGHAVIDRVLLSVGFHNFYSGTIPGFDEAAYVANVLSFLSGATTRLNDRNIVAQLADGALHFLTSIADAPVLKARPELRAQAVSVWRALADKAASLDIVLNTRMDGVIDPRPEIRGAEPAFLEAASGDNTVLQLAPSPDGRFIAQATGDRRIRVWDAATKALVTTIELDDARQLYGDLANSLGVSWDNGSLLITTLHDEKVGEKSSSYNLIRRFALTGKAVMLPADAVSTARVEDAYVLTANADGPQGRFYASPIVIRNDQGHHLGAAVRLLSADGTDLSRLDNSNLLDLQGDRLLASAHGRSEPRLSVWSVANPAAPQDITPGWLRMMVSMWRQRNPASEYGWYPELSAKLGRYQGRPAVLWADRGRLNIYDLETGETLRSLEIPSGWKISPYLTNAEGTMLSAVVTAPGQFNGPNPERVITWDLTTGQLVMDRDATFVPKGWLYTRGQSIARLEFAPDGRLLAAGRNGILVFERP